MKTDSIYLTTFFLLCLACGLCPHLVNHENACAFTKKVGWFSNRTGTSVATAHAAKLPMRIQRECRIQTVPTPYWSFFLRAPLPLGSGSIAKAVYFISKTGWLDTYKEISEMEIGGLLCNFHVRITQNSVFCNRQPLELIGFFSVKKNIEILSSKDGYLFAREKKEKQSSHSVKDRVTRLLLFPLNFQTWQQYAWIFELLFPTISLKKCIELCVRKFLGTEKVLDRFSNRTGT